MKASSDACCPDRRSNAARDSTTATDLPCTVMSCDNLLGREPVVVEEIGVAQEMRGKTVHITGAGGSIGSELCRKVARFCSTRLVLVELSEFNPYAIEQELTGAFPALEQRTPTSFATS